MEQGDVVTRLSKLGADKKRQSMGLIREQMYLEEEARTSTFTVDPHSQQLGHNSQHPDSYETYCMN